MCKVLIVDDEINICKLIINLIDWDGLQLELAGTANDGVSAFQMMQELQPDIVISDIRMAGYDGIELIRRAQECGMQCSFVFVSGYRQFEYAKDAMRYGAVDYLLKPINKDELNRILVRIKSSRMESAQKQRQTEDLQHMLKQSSKHVAKQLFNCLIGSGPISEKSLHDTYEFSMQGLFARSAILKISGNEQQPSRPNSFILQKIYASLEARSQFSGKIILSINHDELACLALYPPESAEDAAAFFARLWTHYKSFVSEYGDFILTVGCGPEAHTVEELRPALLAAQQALDMRFFLGANRKIELKQFQPQVLSFLEAFPDEMKGITAALEAFDRKALHTSVGVAFDALAANTDAVPMDLFNGLEALGLIVRKVYSQADTEAIRAMIYDTKNAASFSGLKLELLRLLDQEMQRSNQIKQAQDEQPIRIAKRYITENYASQLSLDEVALLVNLNPNYFCVLFKKITGKNFNEFLTECRLEEARNLLRTTTLNLTQIAGKVGYKDPKYFSQLFTKHVGLKPKEYRRLYS